MVYIPEPRFELIICAGERAGQYFPFYRNEATIGRSEDNAIVLSDRVVSRHHARLDWQPGRLSVTDLDSTHGTVVDDQLISDSCPVYVGTMLTCGSTTFRVTRIGTRETSLTDIAINPAGHTGSFSLPSPVTSPQPDLNERPRA